MKTWQSKIISQTLVNALPLAVLAPRLRPILCCGRVDDHGLFMSIILIIYNNIIHKSQSNNNFNFDKPKDLFENVLDHVDYPVRSRNRLKSVASRWVGRLETKPRYCKCRFQTVPGCLVCCISQCTVSILLFLLSGNHSWLHKYWD